MRALLESSLDIISTITISQLDSVTILPIWWFFRLILVGNTEHACVGL